MPELLEQELQALPDKYRAAIVLCDLEGKTTRAAARELGCPQGTLSARLVRGRAMLERRLMRKGVTLGAGAVAAALAQNVASASMPLPLVASTVKAASLIAAGQAVSGAVGANVAALTEGVLKAMLMTKIKVVLAVVLAVHLIGAGVGLVYCQTAGSGQDKGGGSPAAQEKADKPVPTDQQPAPKKEATEEAKAGQPIDYQKMAQEARWKQPETEKLGWTMRIMADGKVVHEWPLPLPRVFFVDYSNQVVYLAVFDHWGTGCEVVACDLGAGKLLWRTQLKGVKDNPLRGGAGGLRPNKVRLEQVNNEVLAVYGDENDGQYVEIVDMKTGRTVGHKIFPGRQPEPKEEAREEKKIDYQKMAAEARWKWPNPLPNERTMCLFADGKKVWPSERPPFGVTLSFVGSNCIEYKAFFGRGGTGCRVESYDLKAGKTLWQTQLKGLGGISHREYTNDVRLEPVNDEVFAVYGDEAFGRYIEIVDMKTGKTVGHKVFTKEETDKKPGAKAAPAEDDPAVKECLANLDRLDVRISLIPYGGKIYARYPMRSLVLYVGTVIFEPAGIDEGHAKITKEQAAKIVAVLAKDNFFRASVADWSKVTTPKGPHAVISLSYRKEGATSPEQRWRALQWDLHMVQQLEAIRACVDGDAAKLLDQMLKSLEEERKEWLKKDPKDDAKKDGGADPKAAADAPPAKTDAPKPLPDDIVRAWKEAGAEVGWLRVHPAGFPAFVEFVHEQAGKPGDLPAFGLAHWPEGRLAKLPAPASAFGLDLRSPQVADAELKELVGLKSLQTLSLGYTLVTDAGLKELAGLKNLQTLYFYNTGWRDTELKELVGVKSLQTLYLYETTVTDAGLKELAGLKSLQTLGLTSSQVTDAWVPELAGLKSLQTLSLIDTKVTGAGLKELTGLKSLQTLYLCNTPVTDTGLKELAGLKSLQTLNLSFTPVTDAGLKELAELKSLQMLDLASTKVTDVGLKELAGLNSLQTLNLTRTLVTGAGLKELAELKSLQTLNLSVTPVTGAGLKELAGLKNLQRLDLSVTNVTDNGLKELAGLKSLQTLDLFATHVSDAGLKELAGLKSLQSLSLASTAVRDAGLKELAGLKSLQTLNLCNTHVTDAGLKELAGLKSLQELYIGNTDVTAPGLDELGKRLPGCRIRWSSPR